MKTFLTFILVCVFLATVPAAWAGFTVTVEQDLVTPPTEADLVAYNVFVVGSEGDRMGAFDTSFLGDTIRQLGTKIDEVWHSTPYRKDLSLAGGKYRNDSHFCYLLEELLTAGPVATELNDLSVDEPSGKGYGDLWTTDTVGVVNVYQSETAHLARIVLPEGDTATLNWKVWNQEGESITMGQSVVPEPATLGFLSFCGLALWRRKSGR
ncbi:MAG: hypothetical protein JXA11_06885 [Phycisphaerae bacterium]|nr:hypothetical protein [Phycisphaerae bacterium]